MIIATPAVFRNERLERRLLRLELRMAAFEGTVGVSLKTLAEAVDTNALALQCLGRAMQAQWETLPGEHPIIDSLNAGRGGH